MRLRFAWTNASPVKFAPFSRLAGRMKPQKKTAPGKRASPRIRQPTREGQNHGHRTGRGSGPVAAKNAEAISKIKPEEVPETRSAASAGSAVTEQSFKVPPILLEGDEPSAPAAGGPGQRYALGPRPPVEHIGASGELGELPEAYGTEKLLLAARDPHWLYAHWDLTREQLQGYNARSADGHLVLRIYKDTAGGQPCNEVHVHPESVNWFINVAEAGAKFLAELGFYTANSKWNTISTSGATITPPDTLSEDTSAWFATL